MAPSGKTARGSFIESLQTKQNLTLPTNEELGRRAGLRQNLGLQPNYKTSHSHQSLTVQWLHFNFTSAFPLSVNKTRISDEEKVNQ